MPPRRPRGRACVYVARRRTDDPEGPFYLYWPEAGRQQRRSTGLYDEALAEALAAQLTAEAAERQVFGRARADENVTFAFAALAWLESADTAEARAARERYIRKPIAELGDCRVADVDDDAVRLAARRAYPLAQPATRRRQFVGPVIAVLRWASARPRAWCPPPVDIRRPADSAPRLDWIAPAAAARIIAAAAAAPSLRHAAPAFELGFGAGLRAAEIARLDWADVHLSAGQVFVRTGKSRAATRLVDLPPRAVAALATIKTRDGAVLRTRKGAPYRVVKYGGGLFDDALARAAEAAGEPHLSMHVLRHSWATWRAATDETPGALRRLQQEGGWASLAMVERYAKVAPRSLAADCAAQGWIWGATPPSRRVRLRAEISQ